MCHNLTESGSVSQSLPYYCDWLVGCRRPRTVLILWPCLLWLVHYSDFPLWAAAYIAAFVNPQTKLNPRGSDCAVVHLRSWRRYSTDPDGRTDGRTDCSSVDLSYDSRSENQSWAPPGVLRREAGRTCPSADQLSPLSTRGEGARMRSWRAYNLAPAQ